MRPDSESLTSFPSYRYRLLLPLIITPVLIRWLSPHTCIYIWVRGDTQRTPSYTLLTPKLTVESVSEVPGGEPQKLTLTYSECPGPFKRISLRLRLGRPKAWTPQETRLPIPKQRIRKVPVNALRPHCPAAAGGRLGHHRHQRSLQRLREFQRGHISNWNTSGVTDMILCSMCAAGL